MPFDWDDVTAYGTALEGVALSMHYRRPALKAHGQFLAGTGHESEEAFVLALPLDLVEMAKEVRPDIFYQTRHYEGWASVLVRYAADFADVTDWIDRAHATALTKKPKKPPRTQVRTCSSRSS
ncbi:MAG: hypothetical protein JOY99_17080 [Sphingomonadaceae bacterium]|nr:hypothetical protein [Sphingomonadaceae bacterium]